MRNNPSSFNLCVIVHGCPPDPAHLIPKEQRWMNWIESKLQNQGYPAIAPAMPTPWKPVYTEWKAAIETYPILEQSILVGHSCGAAFLVRWLLETKRKVKKLILVAPAKVPEYGDDDRNSMYQFELSTHARDIANEVVIFTSNDLPHHLKSLELYTSALQPKVIEFKDKGHFLISSMGTPDFPELLEEILKP